MEMTFQYNTIATAGNFIGRRGEISSLKETIKEGLHVVICDIHGSGKSSLIEEGIRQLEEEGAIDSVQRINLLTIRSKEEFIEKTVGDGFPPGRNIIVMDEFQNILMNEDYEEMMTMLEIAWEDNRDTTFVFCGSMPNAMKRIFDGSYFRGHYKEIILGEIDEKEIFEYINRGFQRSGKVIEREVASVYIKTLGGNLWYINQLLSISDSLSRGYINNNVLGEALKMLISLHEPRFRSVLSGMTGFQVNMLEAILDGVTRFCSNDIISQYKLNSSANVKRVRDALTKKEIVIFDDNDKPRIPDPLFKLWAKQQLMK